MFYCQHLKQFSNIWWCCTSVQMVGKILRMTPVSLTLVWVESVNMMRYHSCGYMTSYSTRGNIWAFRIDRFSLAAEQWKSERFETRGGCIVRKIYLKDSMAAMLWPADGRTTWEGVWAASRSWEQSADSQQEHGNLSFAIMKNWNLPTMWMNLAADSSLSQPPEENAAWLTPGFQSHEM